MKEHPTLRYHKMRVAFFDKDAKVVSSKDLILENQEETTLEIDNQHFTAILPNYEDWSFIKVIFDPTSLEFFQNNFSRIENPLTKLLVLRAFYDMVKDAKTRGTDLINTLLNNNAIENSLGNPIMIETVVNYVIGSLTFIPKVYTTEYKHRIFAELLRCLHITKDHNDINILKPQLVSIGTSDTDIDKLKSLLEGTHSNLHLDFTNEEKWRILFRIHCSSLYSDYQKEIHLNHLKTIDSSETAKNWQLAIEATTQSDEKLEHFWKEVTSTSERTLNYYKI